MVDLDFGGTKAAEGFGVIPGGTYNAIIDEPPEVRDTKPKTNYDGVEEEQKASDGTQAQYLNVRYKIIDDEDYEGRLVWGIQSIRFPQNALDDTKKERQTREIFLSWLNNVTGTDFADTKQSLDLKNLVGSKVTLIVIESEYNGEPKNEIKRVLPYEEDNASSAEEVRRSL